MREALQVLRAGHEHDPSSEIIAYNLGVVVERLGDPDGAKKLYQDAIKLDADHSMAWNNLGAIYDRQGDRAEAIKCVIRARQADPLNAEAAYNLGILLMRDNKYQEALPHLNDTLRLNPAFTAAAVQRARALTEVGQNDAALAAWKQLTAVHPGAWIGVARVEMSLGHEKEARAALREGLSKGGQQFRAAAMKDEQLRPLIPKVSPHS